MFTYHWQEQVRAHVRLKGCLRPCPFYLVLKSALFAFCVFLINNYIPVVHRDVKKRRFQNATVIYCTHFYVIWCCWCVEPKAASLSAAAPLCLSHRERERSLPHLELHHARICDSGAKGSFVSYKSMNTTSLWGLTSRRPLIQHA